MSVEVEVQGLALTVEEGVLDSILFAEAMKAIEDGKLNPEDEDKVAQANVASLDAMLLLLGENRKTVYRHLAPNGNPSVTQVADFFGELMDAAIQAKDELKKSADLSTYAETTSQS